jgi:hypothetical protein
MDFDEVRKAFLLVYVGRGILQTSSALSPFKPTSIALSLVAEYHGETACFSRRPSKAMVGEI